MKTFTRALCALALAYLLVHCTVYQLNKDYRERLNDPAYVAGESTKTFYSMIV